MASPAKKKNTYQIKEPTSMSPRIKWLRDYYFKGVERKWNNEFISFTTGTPWDVQYNEMTYYIVPENFAFFQAMTSSFKQTAVNVSLSKDFWKLSLPQRRAWFLREVMVNYLPREVLPGDLIAGARFNVLTSMCLTRAQAKERQRRVSGKKGAREKIKWFTYHGYGNSGATSGHLIPDYQTALTIGWKGIYEDLEKKYNQLSRSQRKGTKGQQLQAMLTAATMPRDVAAKYADFCRSLAQFEKEDSRKQELLQMAAQLEYVPWHPPRNFWEAVQALWLTHMLVMSDENYPGPGTSFGRIDQYLLPYWQQSMDQGMDPEFGKEILKCFWIHANTAYDALIRTGGNQGITAGFGQLITLAGMGPEGKDLANELTYVILDVIDEMSPILEPKPNVRLHRNSPTELMDKIVDMISSSQGAPFLLNFDERSMAGMMHQAGKAGCQDLIHEQNVHDYAPVGCLENTMVGNDRSGTVDNNLDLLKAIELTLGSGKDLMAYKDPVSGKAYKINQDGPFTGDVTQFSSWQQFWAAFKTQVKYMIKKCMETYEASESIRAEFGPTPYLSCLVRGCAQSGKDITQGGAELNFVTLNPIAFATTVDSLLAVKYLVYDKNICTMDELIDAVKANWQGYEKLQAQAHFKAPKYGRDDDAADDMGRQLMDLWTTETWKHRTKSTHRQFRPGLLSWNYWIGDGYILPASPDGRSHGKFLSNAICPVNGMDINGPTANANSAGKVLGGKALDGQGDFKEYINKVPSGASHTITFNPSILKDPEHRAKFTAFLKGYVENGGSALQINMLDPDMLRHAQKNPNDYRHLLVRITGYNAYFVSIGRELQDEVIARLSHDSCG